MPAADAQGAIARYRIAYGSIPKDGGTFTFYRNLRPALLARGIELLCVTVGRREALLVEHSYADEGCVLLAQECSDIEEQARAFAIWCEQERIDIVMAINSVAILSALPHLPAHVRIVARCANAFDEGYRVTLAARERVARIVALTPRLRDDLIAQYGVQAATIALIPNGIDPTPYDALQADVDAMADCAPQSTAVRPLELGFLGRLEHAQKGVLHLPKIVQHLKDSGVPFRLRIAGKGRHERELRRRLAPYAASGEVEFCGALEASEVPAFLCSLDVFLFTSHFEGCPNALLEAMMAGVATVAFQIDGIVDFILDHRRTALVAPPGDCEAFAQMITELAGDREQRVAMAMAAAREARERFTPAVAAGHYARVFDAVMEEPPIAVVPRPWSRFAINPVYTPGWRAFIPEPLKRLARRLREL